MLVQIGDQARGIKLAHIGEFIGEERLLIQPVHQRLGVQRHQLNHAGQLVAAPDVAEAALDRAHGIRAHTAHADDHGGINCRLLKLDGIVGLSYSQNLIM